MHHTNLPAMIRAFRAAPVKGPVALVLAEDAIEVESTLAHHLNLGFGRLIVFADPAIPLLPQDDERIWRVDFDLTAEDALPTICNAMIGAASESWLYYCYNAEYLFYPFCESRSVAEMSGFMAEERRDVVVCATIDLYPADLNAHPVGVDRESAYFDRSGYYAIPRKDDEGAELERQVNLFGGLRWRFEEHIPVPRQRVDRTPFFRARKGLRMLAERRFNLPEYNTYACPWHHNLSGVVASFRTAKALQRNPGSRAEITTFHCPQSERFAWNSQQLLDCGMMEPGQWF